jgi:hypothetical protein
MPRHRPEAVNRDCATRCGAEKGARPRLAERRETDWAAEAVLCRTGRQGPAQTFPARAPAGPGCGATCPHHSSNANGTSEKESPLAREQKIIVIGAGGSQAQAMLRALARGKIVDGVLAVDRAWRPEVRKATEDMGFAIQTLDPLSVPEKLCALLRSTEILVNMAGPYYKTGTIVLDAAIETGTDYMDISDDADVSIPMLERAKAAEAAGIRALIGMGSSPGTTNVLIRAAVDKLGPVEDVDIYWTVDVNDLTEAAIRHFWHCFSLVDREGNVSEVAGWDALDFRDVDFPIPWAGSVSSASPIPSRSRCRVSCRSRILRTSADLTRWNRW